MDLLSAFKRKTPPSKAGAASATGDADEVQRARTRARQRLIGAAVLVVVGIIGFPLLFETQPRPIPVDLPIEIPRKDAAPPLALPAPAASGTPAATQAPPAERVIAETPAEVLHLKTASSLLDAETVLATPALAASGIFADYRVIEVPEGEEGGANVLRVNDQVIAGAGYPRILDRLDSLGLSVVPLANSAIAMIDAGFTCMSLRWRSAS